MSPVRTSRVTPGVSNTKSIKLRPFTGRLATERSSTVELICVRVVSTSGTSAVTVTDSVFPLTDNRMGKFTFAPTVTGMSFRVSVPKPLLSTLRSYTPTATMGKINNPSCVVAVLKLAPFA